MTMDFNATYSYYVTDTSWFPHCYYIDIIKYCYFSYLHYHSHAYQYDSH